MSGDRVGPGPLPLGLLDSFVARACVRHTRFVPVLYILTIKFSRRSRVMLRILGSLLDVCPYMVLPPLPFSLSRVTTRRRGRGCNSCALCEEETIITL